MTREQWLEKLIRKLVKEFDLDVDPENVAVSIGFPSKGIRGKAIGECWHSEAATDGRRHILIHPRLTPEDIMHVLLHELIHASLPPTAKHGKPFKDVAVRCGLTGKMTATVPGEECKARLAKILASVEEFPRGRLTPTGQSTAGPKQTTRMLKVVCPKGCGEDGDVYTLRMTRKWLDAMGAPYCPDCQCQMEEA